EGPMLAAGNRGAGVPKLGADAAVTRVFQHADAAAALDLPPDFAAELKVVAPVIDRPAPVRLHVDAVGVEDLLERLLAGQETDVRHADQRQARPTVGAHAPVRTSVANQGRGLAGCHVAAKTAVPDDIDRLRGDAFVVEGECAEARTVFGARIADHV